MKLLLDENLPKRLKEDFPDHEVFNIRERGGMAKKCSVIGIARRAWIYGPFNFSVD